MYKRKDPTSADETEMLENLFDVMCAILVEEDNRALFVAAEGVRRRFQFIFPSLLPSLLIS